MSVAFYSVPPFPTPPPEPSSQHERDGKTVEKCYAATCLSSGLFAIWAFYNAPKLFPPAVACCVVTAPCGGQCCFDKINEIFQNTPTTHPELFLSARNMV